jgi:hypothetical protein
MSQKPNAIKLGAIKFGMPVFYSGQKRNEN